MGGSSFGGKLFVDGALMCKHGAQGGQTGWAVAQINEATHELVCSAHGAMQISLPVQRRIMRAEQAVILSDLGTTFITDCAAVLQSLELGQGRQRAGRRASCPTRTKQLLKQAELSSTTLGTSSFE